MVAWLLVLSRVEYGAYVVGIPAGLAVSEVGAELERSLGTWNLELV